MTNPTWAGRSATPPEPDDDDDRAGWVPIAGVIAALGLVGLGGYLLGNADGGDELETAVTPTTVMSEASIASTEQEVVDVAPSSTVPSTTVDTTATTAAPADTTVAPDSTTTTSAPAADAQVVVADGEVRGAVLRGGILYLGGAVPSREVADQIIERASAVVGEDNVVDEYIIDPNAELAQGAPLYVDDVVLFAYGSSSYDPQFEPLLDLGLALLRQNPSVIVTVVTHTDASGSTSSNDLLSYRRGQSVAQYWVDRGVPVEQIVIDARGERDPRADNDDAVGAQLNRRAEFYIEGLLP